MRNHAPRQFLKTFLHWTNRVAVEISRPLFEFREILDRTQAAFGSMNLLIENAAETCRVEPEPSLLCLAEPRGLDPAPNGVEDSCGDSYARDVRAPTIVAGCGISPTRLMDEPSIRS